MRRNRVHLVPKVEVFQAVCSFKTIHLRVQYSALVIIGQTRLTRSRAISDSREICLTLNLLPLGI